MSGNSNSNSNDGIVNGEMLKQTFNYIVTINGSISLL